eukprot:scaffold898_cov229-Pinguiococcus_pyrenoidosus.AAC.9
MKSLLQCSSHHFRTLLVVEKRQIVRAGDVPVLPLCGRAHIDADAWQTHPLQKLGHCQRLDLLL